MIYSRRKQFQYWHIPATTKTLLDPEQHVAPCFIDLSRKARASLKKRKYLIFKEIHEFSTAIEERSINLH